MININKLEELRKLFVEAVYEKVYVKDSYQKLKAEEGCIIRKA